MSPTTPLRPRSSQESAQNIVLEIGASRLLAGAWVALHGLLVAAAVFGGVSRPTSVLIGIAVLLHAVIQRPPRPPAAMVWELNGSFRVRGMAGARFVLGARSRLGPYWVRLSLRAEGDTLDVLLVRDQLAPLAWVRLVARLRRVQLCEHAREAPEGSELR